MIIEEFKAENNDNDQLLLTLSLCLSISPSVFLSFSVSAFLSFSLSVFLSLFSMPKGHSAMDKALTWHAGSQGLNPDTTKVYGASILSGTPTLCTLSHNASHHMLHHEYLSWEDKERNHGKILAATSVRQNTDIRAMYGRRG